MSITLTDQPVNRSDAPSSDTPSLPVRIVRAPLRWALLALWFPLLVVSQAVYVVSAFALVLAGRLGADLSGASS